MSIHGTATGGRPRIAVLDDYQNVALASADWEPVTARADVTVFDDHVGDPDELVTRLAPFDVVFVMRERTPLPRNVLERLPRLRMIASTGPANASIDMAAADELGIHVSGTGGSVASTVELTWALILASARHLVAESRSVADGGWQTTVGRELDRRVLGVLGLGRIGSRIARIGAAFGMDVVAWSQNLTPDAAAEAGARYLPRDDFFASADVLTIHLKLSERSRGLIGAAELAAMKPTALLINVPRPDRRRGRADRRPEYRSDRGGRPRRLRHRTAARGASPAHDGQRDGHAAHRLRGRPGLPDLLPGRGRCDRGVARREGLTRWQP